MKTVIEAILQRRQCVGGGEAGWDNLLGRVVGRVVGRMVGPTWLDEEAPNPVHHLAPAAELLSSRFSVGFIQMWI